MRKQLSDKQIHILNIAEELIAKKGFEGTSVREISAKAEVNVAMISYYFGSKQKMMVYLYQHRIHKTRTLFSEFSETIRNGNPEMQLKEIIRFLVSELYRHRYFHGYVTQELRKTDFITQDLLNFYQICVEKIDEVIKKGVASGVFTYAHKAEDVLSIIIGTGLFNIRNHDFISLFIASGSEEDEGLRSEKKTLSNILLTVFASLGYVHH